MTTRNVHLRVLLIATSVGNPIHQNLLDQVNTAAILLEMRLMSRRFPNNRF